MRQQAKQDRLGPGQEFPLAQAVAACKLIAARRLTGKLVIISP